MGDERNDPDRRPAGAPERPAAPPAAEAPEGPEVVEPATLPGDLLGGKFLDPSGR